MLGVNVRFCCAQRAASHDDVASHGRDAAGRSRPAIDGDFQQTGRAALGPEVNRAVRRS
jgi:hypothetical protein